jgi:hypothetical protein
MPRLNIPMNERYCLYCNNNQTRINKECVYQWNIVDNKPCCHKCYSKLNSKRYSPNKERRDIYAKKYRNSKRIQAMNLISNNNIICNNCGCNNINILEINHINGGGREERRVNNYRCSIHFYKAIINGTRSIDDLNILCKICNTLHYISLKFKNIKYNITYISC